VLVAGGRAHRPGPVAARTGAAAVRYRARLVAGTRHRRAPPRAATGLEWCS